MVCSCNQLVIYMLCYPLACHDCKITPCFLVEGGVLFKVYIVGEAIKVVRRFSLPDVSKREISKTAGVYPFPRVSCAAASADDADLEPDVAGRF